MAHAAGEIPDSHSKIVYQRDKYPKLKYYSFGLDKAGDKSREKQKAVRNAD